MNYCLFEKLKILVLLPIILVLNLNLKAQNIERDTTVYTITETPPEFPNGMSALFQFLSKNLKIPDRFKEIGMEGRPSFNFIIEKDGSVSSFSINENSEIWKPTAQELFSKMPRWRPAKSNGKVVRYNYTLVISCIKLE